VLGEALAVAKAIGSEEDRSKALAALVGWLPSTLKVDALLQTNDAGRADFFDRILYAS